MHGDRGEFPVTILDFKYVTGSGKNQTTHRQSVVSFGLPGHHLPRFDLRPEGALAKIGSVFGFQDIDFAPDPTFSNRYLLQGNDEAEIRQIFTTDVRRMLSTKANLSVEAGGERLIVYRASTRVAPNDIVAFLGEATEIASLFYRPDPKRQ